MAEFDYSTFPTLLTPRLVLREIVPADAGDLFTLLSDPAVYQYDSQPPLRELAEAAALIERGGEDFAARRGIDWGITLRGEDRLIGRVAFNIGGDSQVYLAYAMAPSHWGLGIATEAGRALLQFVFASLGVHCINAYIWMENTASVRVVEKLGFRQKGGRQHNEHKEDGTYDWLGFWSLSEFEYRK